MKRTSQSNSLARVGLGPWRLIALVWSALLIMAATPVTAATLRWTGSHPTQSTWSRGANWDTGSPPQDGDTVVFPAGAARLANNNDIAGLNLVAIRFSGAGGGYVLSGNGITVTNSITATNSAGGNTIALAQITLGKDLPFTVAQPSTSLILSSEVRLNGHDLTANATDLLRLDGVISGTGNLVKTGAGELRLGGTAGNSFTGDVFVNEGLLQMNKTGGLAVPHRLIIGDGLGGAHADIARDLASDQVNQVTVNASGWWQLGANTEEVSDLVLNQGGDVTTGGSGLLRLGIGADLTVAASLQPLPDASEISGNLELMLGTHTFTIGEGIVDFSDSTELRIDAVISGFGGFTKEGDGDLLLSAGNSFAAMVHVNAGDLRITHSAALGSAVSGTDVNNDATLWLQGNVQVVDEVLTLNSTGHSTLVGHSPALRASGANNEWQGAVSFLQDTTIGVVAGGFLDLSRSLSGEGSLLKEDNGTLRYSGSDFADFSGDIHINTGTLELKHGFNLSRIPRLGTLYVGDGLGGAHADVLRDLDNSQLGASFGVFGTFAWNVAVSGSGLWDLNDHSDTVATLSLSDGGDVDTGANGLLTVVNGVTASPGAPPLNDPAKISGRLALSGATSISVSEGLTGVLDSSDLVIDAGILGDGFTKLGNGDLLLTGNNTFSGPIDIQAGELRAGSPNALGQGSDLVSVSNDATLWLQGGIAVANRPLLLDSTGQTGGLKNNPALKATGANSWLGLVTLKRDSRVSVETSGNLDLQGVVRGAGGVIKEGDGTLRYSGTDANTYTGPTTISTGLLELNKAAGTTAVAGPLTIGDGTGGPATDGVRCLTTQQLAHSSDVTLASSGVFRMEFEVIGSLSGSGRVVIDSALEVGMNNTSTVFDGDIVPASTLGSFLKLGTGTLTLNGRGSHGSTEIIGGELVINGNHSTPQCLIIPSGTLGGSGQVGNVTCVGTLSPGNTTGRLSASQLQGGPGGRLQIELNGPTAGTDYDQLRVSGPIDLGDLTLEVKLNFIPTIGDSFIIVENTGNAAIAGHFQGLQEGDTLRLNGIPFEISYRGGDGNDVSLTASTHSLSLSGSRIEGGNGDGIIQPGECNQLFVGLMNETSNPLAITRAVLDSTTPGVVVTRQRSEYPVFTALGVRTNATAFEFRTVAGYPCGQPVDFTLTVTVNGTITFSLPFSLPTGSAGTPVRFDNGSNLNLTDLALTTSSITVATAAQHVSKVAVSVHITHPSAGDLILRLQSPSGTTVRLATNLGGTTDNYGNDCSDSGRTTFDDAAATKIAAGVAPFVGTFTPESPLSDFIGEDPNGNWTLLINDTVAGDVGQLRCWSLLLSPPECSAGATECPSCLPTLIGKFDASSPTTTQRLIRDGLPSGCGSPKACPGAIAGLPLAYRVHTLTNNGPAACVTAILSERCQTNNSRFHAAAYLAAFDPANPCNGYLGDTGRELAGGSDSFSFQVPAGATFVIAITSPATLATCDSYSIQLYGLPCPPPPTEPCPEPLLSIRPIAGGLVELSWPSCPSNSYQIAWTTNFHQWQWLTPPLAAPASNSIMTWTTPASMPSQFFRLVATPLAMSSSVPTEAGVYGGRTLLHDGISRNYRIHIPSGYNPSSPAPLMLAIHGHNQTADSFAGNLPELASEASAQGVILVFPDGTDDAQGTGWNILDPTPQNPVDDVGFLLSLIDEIGGSLNIDRKRVYAAGFSNGGQMVHFLAARTTNTFAAFAAIGSSVSGGRGSTNLVEIDPPREPLPILMANATNDCKRPFLGGVNDEAQLQPPVRDSIAHWLNANQCTTTPVISTNTVVTNHVHRVFACDPASYPPFNDPVTLTILRERYQLDCVPGSEVQFVTLSDGGHEWPEASDNVGFDASREVLQFFLSHCRCDASGASDSLLVPTAPGQYELRLCDQGYSRLFRVQVPSSYLPAVPAPVAFVFHGGRQTAAAFSSLHPDLFRKCDAEGVILVLPEALVHPKTGETLWADKPFDTVVDDRLFVTNILERLDAALNVDRARVYAAGFSNGGDFCHWLGSTTLGLFAAVAPVCATTGWVDLSTGALVVPPAPLEPMPVLMLRGGADPERPFNGSPTAFSAQMDANYWVAGNGCTGAPVVNNTPPLTRWQYPTCSGTSEVILIRVAGMVHEWPDAGPYNANIEVIDFLLSHSR